MKLYHFAYGCDDEDQVIHPVTVTRVIENSVDPKQTEDGEQP